MGVSNAKKIGLSVVLTFVTLHLGCIIGVIALLLTGAGVASISVHKFHSMKPNNKTNSMHIDQIEGGNKK